MPAVALLSQLNNRFIREETSYDREQLRIEHNELYNGLNSDQRNRFVSVITVVTEKKGGLFFVYGHGGTGKTYVYRTLIVRLRSEGKIVLAVASSGITALILQGGQTAHSRFEIPINLEENSICGIHQGTQLAELIKQTSLIIWDEAPMHHRHAFEAVDKTLKDILRFDDCNSCEKPFGAKIVLLGGDFRQILPVVPKGGRHEVVLASINNSYL
ncbi:uncharacterized protein LOC143865148 [Tasmannia lanceolata]|uniref:uncharacterized protein LOC143865148 n=1 Tax=Tasmannia lanceolata TaxID=3420 RepID=UPI0040645B4A